MTVVEIFEKVCPIVGLLLLMIGIFYAGWWVGHHEGYEYAKKGQKLVFVVLHQDGTVSAVTQEGKRIGFVTDTKVREAEVPNAND